MHVCDKLIWNFSAQFLQSHLTFLSSNHFIFFFLICDFDALPWKIAPHEINQHKAQALQVIPSGLLLAQMRVQTGISGRPCQTLVVSERDMLIGPGIFVSLGKAVVDDIDVVLAFANADEVVIGLDISMKKTARMDILNALD